MIMILLTFLSALAIAATAAWFSVAGIVAIFSGATLAAIIMGGVLESGKLVTASWLYRNWTHAPFLLRLPLVLFLIVLMFITSMGTYGFLAKAHTLQGAESGNNSAKIERLDQQIAIETAKISDTQKIIAQLDDAVNRYAARDKVTSSVNLRRSQDSQRTQLRDDIGASQKIIDGYTDQKFELQSKLRSYELDVGPVKYIAALIYDDPTKNLESTVRIVTLIIVSVFDPLAVILLIAANYSLVRYRHEKKASEEASDTIVPTVESSVYSSPKTSKKNRTARKKNDVSSYASDDTSTKVATVPEIVYGQETQLVEPSLPVPDKVAGRFAEKEDGIISSPKKTEGIDAAISADVVSNQRAIPKKKRRVLMSDRSGVHNEEIIPDNAVPAVEDSTEIPENVSKDAVEHMEYPAPIETKVPPEIETHLGNYFKRSGFVPKAVVVTSEKPALPTVLGWLEIDERQE